MEVKTPHRQGQWRSRHLIGGRGQTKVRDKGQTDSGGQTAS